MLDLGYISQSEYSEAIAEPINIKLPKAADKVASSVEDLIEYNVIDALVEQGNTRDEAYNMFYNGGLRIDTTIDPTMQETLEKEYENEKELNEGFESEEKVSLESELKTKKSNY